MRSRSHRPAVQPLARRLRVDARRRWDEHTGRSTAFLMWSMGVALAIAAQHELADHAERGGLLFLASAVVSVAGTRLVDRTPTHGTVPEDRIALADWNTRRVRVAGSLIVLGLLGSAATVGLVAENATLAAKVSVWIASIVLVLLGAAIGIHRPVAVRKPRITRDQVAHLALLLGIVALALALRLPRLASIPPDVHADEASVGLDARALLYGGWNNLFGLGFMQMPQPGYAVAAIFMRVFGDDLYGLRMASMSLGVLSVVLLYFVARRLFGTRTALIASFVLAVAQWHIHFSRDGLNNMQAVPAALLVVLCLLRAFETRRELDFVLAGISFGVCAVVYYGGRAAYVIGGAYVLYRLVHARDSARNTALGILYIAVGMWVFLAPIAVTLERSPEQALRAHAHAVWLFTPSNLAHEREGYGESSTLRIVGIQIRNTIEAVNRTGETSEQYGRRGKPLFDIWSAALVVPGVAFALFRMRDSRYLLLLLMLLVPLSAGALTVDALFSPRVLVALPALAIFPALVLDAGCRTAERWLGRVGKCALGVVIVAFGALTLHANYHDYFDQQVKTLRVAGFYTILSRYALSVSARDRVYVVTDPRVHPYPDPTTRFLLQHVDAVDLGVASAPSLQPPPNRGGAFVVEVSPATAPILRSIVRRYPNGVERVHRDANGARLFTSYEVGPEGFPKG
jgi:4-amino-4-deoxy-L-arabinose transferase-like glycosyltransferase